MQTGHTGVGRAVYDLFKQTRTPRIQELTIEPELTDAAALVRELQDFRVSYSTTGNAIFSAREGAHDDLVLAASLAIFGAAHPIPNAALMRLHI